jgi:hypothetical protein
MVCSRCAQVCKAHQKANLQGMTCGQVNLENVDKAKPPMKQSKNSVLTCELVYAML